MYKENTKLKNFLAQLEETTKQKLSILFNYFQTLLNKPDQIVLSDIIANYNTGIFKSGDAQIFKFIPDFQELQKKEIDLQAINIRL